MEYYEIKNLDGSFYTLIKFETEAKALNYLEFLGAPLHKLRIQRGA